MRTPALLALLTAVLLCGACTDKVKRSEAGSVTHAAMLAGVVREDLKELADGMPKGAERSYKAFYVDIASPLQDPFTTQRALENVHMRTNELRNAKASFYALLDADGTAIRSSRKVDLMAGKKLFALFPGLAAGAPKFRTAFGSFDTEERTEGKTRTYVTSSAIVGPAGELKGYLAAGWSYGSFAHHLGETLRSRVRESVLRGELKEKEPVLYVACFDETGLYAESDMPKVTAEELAKQVMATGGKDKASGRMTVEGHDFGWALERVGEWSPTAGVAVARSEL